MIYSIFSSFFLIKSLILLVNWVLFYQDLLLKTFLILILLELYILLQFGGDLKLNKLSKLRKFWHNSFFRYKISTPKELLNSTSYVLIYISIFILGILYLRIQNQNYEINLAEQYEKIKEEILQTSIINNIISFILIILILLTIITIYKKLFQMFKFHIKRIHIYLYQYEIYDEIFWNKFSNKYKSSATKISSYTISSLHYILICQGLNNIALLLKLTNKDRRLRRGTSTKDDEYTWDYIHDLLITFTWKHSFHLHYIVLSSTVLFDLLFNNLTLKNYFYFLPFFFLYHNWLRFSNTIDLMGFGHSHQLMVLLYKNWHNENNTIYDENEQFICTTPEGFENLYIYIDTFVSPDKDYVSNHFPRKGRILSTLEKPLILAFSSKFGQNIIKYNYRNPMVKTHKILIKIIIPTLILLTILRFVIL